jgi:NADH-quinone oxidoreductase subunit J
LITAALGAMVLAHRERPTPKPTQKDLSMRRFEGGRHPAPLPGPGTYARHNAVDMPALLPDGSVSELSVNPVIGGRPELNLSLHTDLEGETEREAVADDVAAVRAATVRGEAEPLPGGDARSDGRSDGRSGAKEDDR